MNGIKGTSKMDSAAPRVTAASRRSASIITRSRLADWGWLPYLALSIALGLSFVALANARWRAEQAGADAIFWIGLLVMYVPVALRMAYEAATREERIGLIVLLGLAFIAVKLFYSPLRYKAYDELLHLRTAYDIVQTGQMFTPHPILPVSPYYPGMETITAALNQIGGIDLFTAGMLVVTVGRVVFVISLYMFYQRIVGSERLAGLAALLYMANPSFIFFDGMFSYESLALPFAGLYLFSLSRWMYVRHNNPTALRVTMVLAAGAMIITHHLTSYAMLALLSLWAGVDTVYRRYVPHSEPHAGWISLLFVFAGVVVWLAFVAPITMNYLAPEIISATNQLMNFLFTRSGGRELFSTHVGTMAPLVEQMSGYAAVGLIVLFMGLGLYQIWRSYRQRAPVVALGLAALAYPLTQAFRLVQIKADIPGRSVEFVFLPLVLVLSIGLVEIVLPRLPKRIAPAVIAASAGILLIGGVAVGWRPLPPGPYRVAATTRSVDPISIQSADWVRAYLGTRNRIAADRINGLLLVTHAEQYQVTMSEDWILVPQVFFAPLLGPDERYTLWEGQIEYLVVDRRLSSALPFIGFYYEQGEPDAFQHEKPINASVLFKFDNTPEVSRIYDNGSIQIYEVRAIWNEP